jgi:lipid-A-disaccharide synthase-like uncharacterized protein
LQLLNDWHTYSRVVRISITIAPVLILLYALVSFDLPKAFSTFSTHSTISWIGLAGQLLLSTRFIYQWYHSEKEKNSVLPAGFWAISVCGSFCVIYYSFNHPVLGFEPVLFVSQAMGMVVYLRNLSFFLKKRNTVAR